MRTWKIDRMLDAEATLVPFQRPKKFDVKQYFEGAFAIVTGSQPVTVKIRFSGTAARYVQEKRMHDSQQLEMLANGIVDVTFRLTSTFEIKSWILSFGASAEVIEPSSLRMEIQAELERTVQLYRQIPTEASP